MRFAFESGDLSAVRIAENASALESDAPLDLINDICNALADKDAGRFLVSGFGDEAWPVDVRFDLAGIVSQLVEVHEGIQRGEDVLLDFFGQGVERVVTFARRNTAYLATCRSRLEAWQSDPASVVIPADELAAMVQALAHSFVEAIRLVAPAYLEHRELETLLAVARG